MNYHYVECDACGKRIKAATILVMRQLERAHYAACDKAKAKKYEAACATAAQLKLF